MDEQQQAIIMVLREFEQLALDHVQTAQAIDALYQSQLTALKGREQEVIKLARVYICDWCKKGSPAGFNITEGEHNGLLYHRIDDEPVECDANAFILTL